VVTVNLRRHQASRLGIRTVGVQPTASVRIRRATLTAAAAGLLARLLFIGATAPLTLSSDEQRFWDLATTRMSGTAFLPPLQPFLLAALRGVVGEDISMVRIATAVLASVSIILVGILAERHLGTRAGSAAAWIAALLPTLVYYDGRLRGEPAVILFLLLFGCLWSRPGAGRHERLLAGACLGMAALGRPELLLLPPVLAAIGWLRRDVSRAILRVVWLAPGILMLVVPWSMRAHWTTGNWAIVSANGGYNFWKSFNPVTDGSQVPLSDSSWDGSAAIDAPAVGYRAGIAFIRRHPARSAFLAPLKVAHLFGPERDLLSDVRQGHLPSARVGLAVGCALLQNAVWFGLMAVGFYALAGSRLSEAKDVALALLAVLVLVHMVFFGDDRFHVPLLPFLCAMLPEAWDGRRRSTPIVIGTVAFLAAEVCFWGMILVRDLGRLSGMGAA